MSVTETLQFLLMYWVMSLRRTHLKELTDRSQPALCRVAPETLMDTSEVPVSQVPVLFNRERKNSVFPHYIQVDRRKQPRLNVLSQLGQGVRNSQILVAGKWVPEELHLVCIDLRGFLLDGVEILAQRSVDPEISLDFFEGLALLGPLESVVGINQGITNHE